MFQKWYNRIKEREGFKVKLKKKNSLIKLALTERLYNSLGILFFIVVFPLAFLCLAGLVYVVAHIPRWIFKYAFLILFSGAVSFCVVATAIKMKRMFVGLWLSSKLPLSEDELKEVNVSCMEEYLVFLDKYIGKNKLYISSEHLTFMSKILNCCGPLFLITESSVEFESKMNWWRLNKHRFNLYDLGEVIKDYNRYGVETDSWRKTGIVLAINNAAVHKDVRKDRLLSVWGKPEYDNSFEFNVAQDSCLAYLRKIKGRIVHKENIGRRI